MRTSLNFEVDCKKNIKTTVGFYRMIFNYNLSILFFLDIPIIVY